jgi:hypothetical protein
MATWFIYTNRFNETRRILTDGRVFEFTPEYLTPSNIDPSSIDDFNQSAEVLRRVVGAVGFTHPRDCVYNKGSWNHTHIRVFDIEENEWKSLFKNKISKYGPLNLNQEIQDVINVLDNTRPWYPNNIPNRYVKLRLTRIQKLIDPHS